jgi:hypothetical protein
MVLAPCGDRKLFGRPFFRSPRRDRLARDFVVVVSSTIAVGPIAQSLSPEGKPIGEGGKALQGAFPRFADDLTWWVEAAKVQRARKQPPY